MFIVPLLIHRRQLEHSVGSIKDAFESPGQFAGFCGRLLVPVQSIECIDCFLCINGRFGARFAFNLAHCCVTWLSRGLFDIFVSGWRWISSVQSIIFAVLAG